ncbi:MAG: VWA domain-containing protein [Pyrinomonadaceae bacterium]|nr:VWA domain-containing protein [Pyrinomonadaceae bacterium]
MTFQFVDSHGHFIERGLKVMLYRSQMMRVALFALVVMALLSGGAVVGPQHAQQQPQQGGAPAARPTQTPSSTPTQNSPRPRRDDDTTLDDDEVLRVESDLTNVLFTAVDKNKRFVTTVKQEDIRVIEDGVPQEIFTFQRETDRPLSLAILIDTSGSQERTLPEEKDAARAFVDAVIRAGKDEVAVISFTGEIVQEQGLTGNVERVRRAIDRVEYIAPTGYLGGGIVVGGTPPIAGPDQTLLGWTALWDAIWVTSEEVLTASSDKTRRAIILLSDGADTKSQKKMSEAIDRAIKADAVIYSVGIGDRYTYGIEESSLRKLSERTGGRAYFPRDETDLRTAFAQIQQELRSQYLVAYSPTRKIKDGTFRQVKIEVLNPELRKQNLRLTYRQGYFAKGATSASITPRP